MIDIENMKKLLSQVKAELLGGCQEDYNAKMNAEYIAPLEEALTELERLQKKETPMKVGKSDLSNNRFCPVCKTVVDEYHNLQYCGLCNQKLDWSDEK